MILDRAGIEALLPHREPFLMLDRITALEPGVAGTGEKDVTEALCAGHFPGHPVMPGVLIAEAAAQLAGVVALAADPARQGRPVYLVGLDKFRFRRPVNPGDTLRVEVRLESDRRRMLTFEASAWVGDQRVANGSLLATAPDA